MSWRKSGNLAAATAAAAGTALVSSLAVAQFYYPSPPPAQMYYPPPPVESDELPAVAQPRNLRPPAQFDNRQDDDDSPATRRPRPAIAGRGDREDQDDRPALAEPDDPLPGPSSGRLGREDRAVKSREDRSVASREDRPAADAAAAPTPENNASGTTTPVHAVSLRSGPSGSAGIIGTLHPGMPLEVLGTANHGWVEVRSSAGTGWAYGSYLAGGLAKYASSGESGPNGGDQDHQVARASAAGDSGGTADTAGGRTNSGYTETATSGTQRGYNAYSAYARTPPPRIISP
ncbi:MAG TPA: SH3 domain-containing protein [Stellaceae bacterium]|nr:SH3 domain-containing protein [Stellaceae bacterium]